MEDIKKALEEFGKQLLAKGATAMAAVLLTDRAIDLVIGLVHTPNTDAGFSALKVLSLLVGYAVWTQAVVPLAKEFFNKVLPPGTSARSRSRKRSRFELI